MWAPAQLDARREAGTRAHVGTKARPGVSTRVQAGKSTRTLAGGYLLWWGGTYPRWGGTYPMGGYKHDDAFVPPSILVQKVQTILIIAPLSITTFPVLCAIVFCGNLAFNVHCSHIKISQILVI